MKTLILCRVHDASAESLIARCFYALWANALDRCELREVVVYELPQVEGQETLEVGT